MLDPDLRSRQHRRRSGPGCATAASTPTSELEDTRHARDARAGGSSRSSKGSKRAAEHVGRRDRARQAAGPGHDARFRRPTRARGQQIKQLEIELDAHRAPARRSLLMTLPNLPHASVPVGKSAADNVEVRRGGEPRAFDFEPQAALGSRPGARHHRLRARDARSPGARFAVLMRRRARGSSARSSTSCSTCTRASTATARSSRRSWSTAPRSPAPASCRSSRRISSRSPATGICT